MIKWDVIEGGKVYLRYPGNLEIPENVIQQIQISHNFVEGKTALENYIITELNDWYSVSFSNPQKEIIIVLVLDKYDYGHDFIDTLGEFNKTLNNEITEPKLQGNLKSFFESLSDVFRTRDEVLAQLGNQVAQLKMNEYDLKRRFEKVINSHLQVRSKILYLLTFNETLSYSEIKKFINTSKRWLERVLTTLIKTKIIGFNNEQEVYFLRF